MQYKLFGKTGFQASILGFGVMRLPMTEEKKVDMDKSIPLIQRGIDLGITYFDTAYRYGDGESEVALGRAIKAYDRSKMFITTKIPVDSEETADAEDWRKKLTTCLERLDSPYIDALLFHGLRWNVFESFINRRGAALDAARKAKTEGLIRHIGFSSHDSVEGITRLIDTGEFEVMLVQYNYLDRHNEPVIERADQRCMGVSIMGPVAGGRLATPQGIVVDEDGQLEVKTPELALRFVWSNPHVHVANSGMSTIEQVEENVASASKISDFDDHEGALVQQLLEKNQKLADLYCTGCNYCMPCPNAINIPENFRYMNWYRVWGMENEAREAYAKLSAEGFWAPWTSGGKIVGLKASECTQCGECLPLCPQNIPIIDQLEEVASTLG
jgi:predicted aldo/keto reductase-like oxidoreductase